MSVIIKLKNNIRKYIRKYMVVALSLIMFPLLSVNSYAAYSTYPQYDMNILTPPIYLVVNDIIYQYSMSRGDDSNYIANVTNQYWQNGNDVYVPTFLSNSTETDDKFYFPINTNLFDYYVVVTFGTDRNSVPLSISDWDIGNFSTFTNNNINFNSSNILTDKKTYFCTYDIANGDHGIQLLTLSAKLNLDYVGDLNLGVIKFDNVNCQFYGTTTYFTLSVIVANKGDTEAYNDIVTAINNQTNSLVGKLDGIDSGIEKGNDLIENGNSGTESTITDFNEVFDDFNSELDNLESFDDEIIGEFNAANETYMTELNNFSLSGSLLNAGNWLSTSMQTVYDNSSDYKMVWLVPLLFGIPILLFIIRKSGDE